MEEFLRNLIGKRIDAFCGANYGVRGEVVNVESGLLQLRDEDDEICYVAVDKIIAVREKHDKERQSGFVFKS
jgi:hypothetical protein